MNIVWVKAGGLLPLTAGGRSRSFSLLKYLARNHSVSLFTYYSAQKDDPHPSLRTLLARVDNVPMNLPAKGSAADYLLYARTLPSWQPYSFARYYQRHVAGRLRQFLHEPCDVIICDFLLSARVIPWDMPCPKVLFTHNVEAVIWERHYQVANNPLWKLACWREWKLTARAERKYLRKADLVLSVSQGDATSFAEFVHPHKIAVIPTGVDTEYFRPSNESPNAASLVFTGSMDWLANEDAMVFFASEILPLIRQREPNTSLWIVGRSPTERVQTLASLADVHVTGTVDDVRPYIAKAEVYVVPLRVGSGTRLKIFEAMAMGKAIVSTSIGAEGLPVTHGENILLADTPADFAQAVIDLLNNVSLRQSLGNAARLMVDSRYSEGQVGAIFEGILKTARR